MNIYLDCIPCFVRQSLEAARYITDDPKVHEQILQEVLRLAIDLDLEQPPPWVAQLIHRRLREITGVKDPYRAAKKQFNKLALAMLPELRDQINREPEPLIGAAKVAIAANVIDFGVKSDLCEQEVAMALREACAASTHGDFAAFKDEVARARDILYLADNTGEIVLDRLLVEQLGPERVTVVVRGWPVLNDATMEDAREVGMTDLVTVIDNGSDAPGTILDDCTPELRERFWAADLIISKGQGNFETLSSVDANIYFLLKVKCPVIATHMGLPLGTHTLTKFGRAGGRAGGVVG